MKKGVFEIRTRWLKLSFLAALLLTFTAGWGMAGLMPVFEHLAPLATQLSNPNIVTVDSGGGIYVAETGSNHVRIYSQSGCLLHTISGLAKPISLAVDGET